MSYPGLYLFHSVSLSIRAGVQTVTLPMLVSLSHLVPLPSHTLCGSQSRRPGKDHYRAELHGCEASSESVLLEAGPSVSCLALDRGGRVGASWCAGFSFGANLFVKTVLSFFGQTCL